MLRLMFFSLASVIAGISTTMQSGFSLPWWGWLILILIIVMMVIILIQGSEKIEPDVEENTDIFSKESVSPTAENDDPFSRNILATAEIAAEKKQADLMDIDNDDFTIIEGIGPKINDFLHKSGIITFEHLAGMNMDELDSMLADANFGIADPETWAEQAGLAAKGDWDSLKDLQMQLKGGRRVS